MLLVLPLLLLMLLSINLHLPLFADPWQAVQNFLVPGFAELVPLTRSRSGRELSGDAVSENVERNKVYSLNLAIQAQLLFLHLLRARQLLQRGARVEGRDTGPKI